MERCEKIKAALSHFFSFYIEIDGIETNKLECIFINFELFDAWYNFLVRIIEKNRFDRMNGKIKIHLLQKVKKIVARKKKIMIKIKIKMKKIKKKFPKKRIKMKIRKMTMT